MGDVVPCGCRFTEGQGHWVLEDGGIATLEGDVDFVAACDRYLPLVHHAVASYAWRLPGYVDVDDLTGAALLGLVEAARRFDPSRGVPFEAWALTRIRGAILDAARSVDPAARSTRSQGRRFDAAVEELTHSLGRSPTSDEVSGHLGISSTELSRLRARIHQALLLSLDDPLPGDTGSFSETLVDADVLPSEALERSELDAHVHECVRELPDRLRFLVEEYFFKGRTSAEIAQDLQVTESRVSQLRSEAMRRLRDALGSRYDDIHDATAHVGSSASPFDGQRAGVARSMYSRRSASVSALL